MKRDLIQFVLAFFALAFGGAAEDLLPKMVGVGFPVLLSAAAYYAVSRPPLSGLLFAAAAGAAEDSLCGLSFAPSIAFFLVTAGLLRGFKLPLFCAAPAFACYQLWLWIWFGNALNGSVFARFFTAVPVGALTLAAVCGLLMFIDGRAAVHEK